MRDEIWVVHSPIARCKKASLLWCKNPLACSMRRGRTVIYLLQNLLQRWCDAETLHHPLESWAKRVTWDLDSCCIFASDATVCNADLLAMWVEQCSNHQGVTERSVEELRQLVGCPYPEEANALLSRHPVSCKWEYCHGFAMSLSFWGGEVSLPLSLSISISLPPLSPSLSISISLSLYHLLFSLSLCVYIYICCGVIIWAKFGLLRCYYLGQVCFLQNTVCQKHYKNRGFSTFSLKKIARANLRCYYLGQVGHF